MVEGGDPGGDGVRLTSSAAFSSGPAPPPTEVEIELFVDRLRFMGIDRDVVDDFDRRARLDWRAEEALYFTGGLCSTTVAAVETTDIRGTRRQMIDPDRPFFVTGVHGTGRVRILDETGEVLRGWTGDELSFTLGSDDWDGAT